MGWEQRGAHQYYYQKVRNGTRVRSVYVGRGEIAQIVSDLQSISGVFERALSIAYPSEGERLREQDAKLDQACQLIESMTHAALLAAGFHMHRRQWRKKRYDHSAKESGDAAG